MEYASQSQFTRQVPTFGAFMQNSIAIDYLDETEPVKVTFTISERLHSDMVSASVTFSARGLQPIHPEGTVSLNGTVMLEKKLQKHGYWYPIDSPRADEYQLHVKRSSSGPESVYTILPRKFIPKISPGISRSKDVIIQYDGPLIVKPERIFITIGSLASDNGGQPWEITPQSEVVGNGIVIPANEVARAKNGRANFYVGLSSFQQTTGTADRLTYAVGQAVEVSITD